MNPRKWLRLQQVDWVPHDRYRIDWRLKVGVVEQVTSWATREIKVRSLAETRDFSLLQNVQTGCGARPDPLSKRAWRWSHHDIVQWLRMGGVCTSNHHVVSWPVQVLLYPSWSLRSIEQCWNENLWRRAFNISRWNVHSIAALRLYSNCHHGSTVIFCCYLLLYVEQLQFLSPTETSGSPSNVSTRSLASV